jgi:hypothetical protein
MRHSKGKQRRRLASGALATLLCAMTVAPADAAIGLYSREGATFFLKNTPTPGPADLVIQYGAPAPDWIPLVGDWDGDELVTIGLHSFDRALSGLRNRNDRGFADAVEEGPPGAMPLVGDWGGDGFDSLGWYDVDRGVFTIVVPFVAILEFQYGPGGGHVPLVGDWDGDGRDTIGVYVEDADVAFLKNTNEAGAADVVHEFSRRMSGELVIAGDFDGDGVDTVARFDPVSSTFFVHDDLAAREPSLVVQYGPPGAGWVPVAWEAPADFKILSLDDGFRWDPRPPSGRAVAVLRPSLGNKVAAVEAHRDFPPNQTTLIGTATFLGLLRPGAFWGFDRPGAAFGRNFYVVLFMNDGRTLAYPIPDGASRLP